MEIEMLKTWIDVNFQITAAEVDRPHRSRIVHGELAGIPETPPGMTFASDVIQAVGGHDGAIATTLFRVSTCVVLSDPLRLRRIRQCALRSEIRMPTRLLATPDVPVAGAESKARGLSDGTCPMT